MNPEERLNRIAYFYHELFRVTNVSLDPITVKTELIILSQDLLLFWGDCYNTGHNNLIPRVYTLWKDVNRELLRYLGSSTQPIGSEDTSGPRPIGSGTGTRLIGE